MDIQTQLEISMLFEDVPSPGEKRVAVVIGRFNLPTKGHYEVINQVKKFIRDNPKLQLNALPVVVVIGGSKSDEDKVNNPLTIDERITFMQSSGQANGVKFMNAKNAFDALIQLRNENMEPIAIAAGSDRAADYMRILDKYFKDEKGEPIKHHRIMLKRDSDAVEPNKDLKNSTMDSTLNAMKDGEDLSIDIVSGSLARRAAELGYEQEFAEIVGLQGKPALAKKLYAKVKASIAKADTNE